MVRSRGGGLILAEPSPSRVRVSGYKSIESMDLELRTLNVLIGANGAGKSNFISLFTLLNEIVESRLQTHVATHGGADALLHYGSRKTKELVIRLDFPPNGYGARLIPAQDSLVFGQEDCYYQGPGHDRPFQDTLGIAHKETKLLEPARRVQIKDYVLEAMRTWRVYHFNDTSDDAPIKKVAPLEDNVQLRPNASNLAPFLYFLKKKHPDSYERIVKTVRLAAPFFKDFDLKPSRLSPNKIQLEWVEQGSDAYMNAYSLSDGTLRFMCLATLLLQPSLNATVVIDEPELGLHPYAIVLLAQMLSAASEQATVIVSTQSVPLVNQFTPEDVIVVERQGGPSTFRRLSSADMSDWLDDYGLGDLWEKNVLGGRPQR